jgi:hypothetical protein
MKTGKGFEFNYSDSLMDRLNTALKYDAKFFCVGNIYIAIDSIAYINVEEKDGK